MKIIAVTNNKGGVGKTHTVFHLAGALAEQGQRVLTIDLDPQGNLSHLFSDDSEPTPTIYDVLVEDVPLQRAVHKTAFDGISVVPSSKRMQNLDALLQSEPDAQIRLSDAIQELATPASEQPFDTILFDCPPSLGLTTRNALAAAQRVIIPIEADRFSVEGLERLIQAIESMRRAVNANLEIAGVLISLYNKRRAIEQLYATKLQGYDIPIFETKIKDSSKYREAIAAGKPITYYQPKSEYADAFRGLAQEVELVYAR